MNKISVMLREPTPMTCMRFSQVLETRGATRVCEEMASMITTLVAKLQAPTDRCREKNTYIKSRSWLDDTPSGHGGILVCLLREYGLSERR